MSSPAPTPTLTITAHPSKWYLILISALQAAAAANPFIATLIPAPVEAEIQIATTLGPVVAGTVEAATNPATAQPNSNVQASK